jgi:hypothetical protein
MATVIVNPGNTLIVSAPGPQGPQGAGGGGGGGSGTVTSVTAGDGLLGGTITTSGTIDVNFGSAGNTVCEGNDARLSDARTPTTHSHVAGDIGSITGPALIGRSAATTGTAEAITLGSGLTIDGSKQLTISASYAQQSVTMTAGTGLTGGGDLSASRTFAVAYGSTASTACEGNDARLSDARTPTAHTHALADIQQGGATTNQVVTWNGSAWVPSSPSGTGTVTSVTGGTGLSGGTITTSGTLAVSYGTTSGTACEGNDSRLSDARTPTSHTHAPSDITQGGATTGQVLEWSGSAWAPATPTSGGSTIGTRTTVFEHFIGGDPQSFSTASGGSGSSGLFANQPLVGVWTIRTGTSASANQRGALNTNLSGFAFDDVTSAEFQCNAAIDPFNFSTTSGEEGFCNIGFIDNAAAAMPTDGAFFRTQDGGNWYAVTRSGGTETATDSGVLPSSTYRTFKIVVEDVAGTLTAKFYIDGTLKATHTTNIPIGSDQTGIGTQIVRTGATGLANSFNMDWIYYDIDYADVTL